MKRKLTTKNKVIRAEATKILEGNAWAFVGAMILVSIIPGIITAFNTQLTNASETGGYIALGLMLLGGIISSLLNMGLIWATVKMVDSDRFEMGKLFKPLTQRPVRNFGIVFFYNLFFILISFIFLVLFGAAVFTLMPNVIGTISQLVTMNPMVTGEFMVDSGLVDSLLPILGAGFGLYLLINLLILVIYYRWVLIHYLPYDNNQIGIFKAFKVSGDMMKGNKFKLFRIDFFYGLMMFLFVLFSGVAVFLVGTLVDSVALTVVLGVVLTLATLIIILILSLRLSTARALFYRLLTDEYGADYEAKYPFLEMAPAPVEATPYHTEPRPTFAQNTTAIEPGNHVQTEPAANYDADEEDQSAAHAAPQGAAGVFTAAHATNEAPVEASEEMVDEPVEASETDAIEEDEGVVFEAYEETSVHEEEQSETKEFVNLAADETGVQDASLDAADNEVEQTTVDGEVVDVDETPETDSKSIEAQASDAMGMSEAEPSADQVNVAAEETGVTTEEVAAEETAEEPIEKKPYNIMGYNTPSRTKFNEVDDEEDVFYAAEKAQTDDATGVNFDEDNKQR